MVKYRLSFFDGSVVIERIRRRRAPMCEAWLGTDASAGVGFGRGCVKIPLKDLAAFATQLPKHLGDLHEKRRKTKKRYIECKIDNGEITFRGNASKAIRQFAHVYDRVWPLLNLASNIAEQINRAPLAVHTSLEIFVPNKQIDGIPVKEWLEIRTEAALKIDPETALILRSHICPSNPYGTYSKIPEHCEEIGADYYARSPGSDVWVYSGDLPKEVARALEKKHKINRRLVSYSY